MRRRLPRRVRGPVQTHTRPPVENGNGPHGAILTRPTRGYSKTRCAHTHASMAGIDATCKQCRVRHKNVEMLLRPDEPKPRTPAHHTGGRTAYTLLSRRAWIHIYIRKVPTSPTSEIWIDSHESKMHQRSHTTKLYDKYIRINYHTCLYLAMLPHCLHRKQKENDLRSQSS